MAKPIVNKIEELEYELQKIQFVLKCYPDALYFYDYDYKNKNRTLGFCSKSVNTDYTHINFLKDSYSLYAMPFSQLTFRNNNKEEDIKVHSSPKQNRLAYIINTSNMLGTKSVIKFSRFVFNLKKHNFRDDVFNECRAQILSFIQEHPESSLDSKHLEDRLKKLLTFT